MIAVLVGQDQRIESAGRQPDGVQALFELATRKPGVEQDPVLIILDNYTVPGAA